MFQTLIEECKLRNYSPKTIKAYLHYNQRLLKFCKKKPQEINYNDIRTFLLYLISKGSASSTVNLAHNAINFYYKEIMKRNFNKIAFQKRESKVKEILSAEEIKRLIKVSKNPKHKLIISLLYASGIRVSELIKIKLSHLDLDRKLLLVKQGKGKKDRYTILSENIVKEIELYLWTRKVKNQYLFPSYNGTHLSVRAVQEVLCQAARKARIVKIATPHRLRHSFATHLMERDVKDSAIQKLLGHKDIRTTQQYARVTHKHFIGIKSPHDYL